ncbi:unnamed protein product [Adineta ricciae]|uniref:G-protein coupled receptors family 1 profile domain-containing protein n=1 Tax=Adineta ricciae TaxID=249248 RepID=A0A813VM08_ADIRI|nr:unnamed protein product [Adineta ricciae]CAF1117224.1 unnamed protein product [Adineta ricciae]
MSSSDAILIASINNATVQMNRYLPLIIFIFGLVGNLLNTLILSRRTLRTNPCALLFLVSSLSGIIAIISGLTTRLTAGWAVDLSETIGWLCKLRIFVLFVSRTMVIWFLVFASIDRWLSSCKDVQLRHLSSLKNSYRSILLVILFSIALNGPLLYCYEANLVGTPAKCFGFTAPCRLYTDLAFTCGNNVVPSLAMLLFGLLTIRNIHSMRNRVNNRQSSVLTQNSGIKTQQQQQKKTDRSLFRMLCVQILFLILCTAPYTIYRLYSTVTPPAGSKPALQNVIEVLLFNFCTNLTYLATAMPFYIYTLCGGKVFRNEFYSVIADTFQKLKCA